MQLPSPRRLVGARDRAFRGRGGRRWLRGWSLRSPGILVVAVRLAAFAAPFLKCTAIEVDCDYALIKTPNQLGNFAFCFAKRRYTNKRVPRRWGVRAVPSGSYRSTRPELAEPGPPYP